MALGDYTNALMPETRNNYVSTLPEVSDPEATNSALLRQDYNDYVQDFRPFEEQLLASVDDTSLVDRVPEDVRKQQKIAEGIQSRNLSRYGGAGLSIAQKQEQNRALQRQGAIGLAGGLNTARIAQDERNKKTLSDLINIGQGLNRSAMAGLGNAANLQANRQAAYKGAKAQHHNAMVGLGTTAVMAILGI
jgi:hypothetical protein